MGCIEEYKKLKVDYARLIDLTRKPHSLDFQKSFIAIHLSNMTYKDKINILKMLINNISNILEEKGYFYE